MTESPLIREFYDAFQRAEFDRWDPIADAEMVINTPLGFGVSGLQALKDFAGQLYDLAWRIDLVDEHLALDADGNGRGFISFCLNWKHTKVFLGFEPTGREGTSIETLIFTLAGGRITQIDVSENTLDLVMYEAELGWPIPDNVHPDALLTGVDRR
ncbi:conserved hypothetical protein [Catenulispora acidiphila DSM 44928]|uniref:SnoaL-like domain-containing protein n=1 Tax=Catenulispora acidiphila (strain DSM 44928 / JCM 14897 / NBRC 102108 / NRRL B-24433 / ID139908) TaxID=479433 RepID=C7Q9T3_CATAD|nr:nuclear transport factor 2 family protein [Catenulispora acidiphila]ACU76252.1 conserved hypothetical protein [Catenulispora acidiphila DSM 44928]